VKLTRLLKITREHLKPTHEHVKITQQVKITQHVRSTISNVSSLICMQQVGEDQFDDTLGGQELEMIKMIEDVDKVQIS